MFRCLKCGLEFGEQSPDYCPVCHTICYICPWCGSMTDASQLQCSMPDCGKPIKYVRMTPDLRDVMRLGFGETVVIGHVEAVIERALYSSARVTVYRAKVTTSTGGKRSQPVRGETVIIREVMDDCSARVQAVISKLLSLRHPNIVRTYAGETDEDRYCYRLVQAWVGERTLASAYLQEEGGRPPDDKELACISVALAEAVEHLHERGIIHGDITPFNVLLDDNGTPVLADFGIATLLEDPGKPRGYTPGYAPMELLPADDIPQELLSSISSIGAHTDRYMLGAALYAVASGRDGRSVHPVTRMPVLIPPTDRANYELGLGGAPQTPLQAVRPDIDDRMASWIDRLMALGVEDRFGSDAEMLKRILWISRRVGKRRIFFLPRLGRLRRPVKVLSAAVLILLLVFFARHAYTLTNSPLNLPALALADVTGVFKGPQAALNALDRAPAQSAELNYRKGMTYEHMGKLDEALKSYKHGQSLDPKYRPAKASADRVREVIGRTSHQRGMQLYRAGEYYLANQQLSKAVHCGVCSTDTYKALAHIAERRGDLHLAAKHWDTVSKFNPDSVLSHYKAAALFLAVKQTNKAYHHTIKARDLHNKPKPMNDVSDDDLQQLVKDVADACLRAGQLDVAHTSSIRRIHEKLVWVNRALNLHSSAAVYARVGRYYERLGDLCTDDRRTNYYDRAVENLNKARKLKPDSSTINTDLARCLNKQRV